MKDKITILVADDDDLNLEILVKTVEDLGHIAIPAEDGLIAWNKILEHQENLDLIILDRMMPEINGFELDRKVRTELKNNHIPVIIQSGKCEDDVFLSSFNAGSMFYIKKPFEFVHMENFITMALNRKHISNKLLELLANNKPIEFGNYKCNDFSSIYKLAAKIALLSDNKFAVAGALTEIMINALEHGNLGIGQEKLKLLEQRTYGQALKKAFEASSDKFIEIDVSSSQNIVNVKISDQGQGFDYKTELVFDHKKVGKLAGRGIYFAKRSLNLEYLGNGNQVISSFKKS